MKRNRGEVDDPVAGVGEIRNKKQQAKFNFFWNSRIMSNQEETNVNKNPEFDNVDKMTVSHQWTKAFVEVHNEACLCLLTDVGTPLFCEQNVNLSRWLDALKRLKLDFEKVQSSELVLKCISVREPYHKLKQQHERIDSEDQDKNDDYEAFIETCKRHFEIKGELTAMRGLSWPPKIYMPIVSENVYLNSGPGWGFHIYAAPEHKEEAEIVNKAMFVENSREFLYYYSDVYGLSNGVFNQFELLCQNAFRSLFPFPDELTDMLYMDVKSIFPSGNCPVSIWTFLLFNLAWKLPPYSRLRAKHSNNATCGQYVFRSDVERMSIEFVRETNLMLYMTGRAPFAPQFSESIEVKNIVSALENLFAASLDAIELLIHRVEELINPPLNRNMKIEERHLNNEKLFCTEIVEPLLHSMGYKNIRYTHGPNELGKDFIAIQNDSSGEYYISFVVKTGDVSGKVSSNKVLDEILAQVEMAFDVPHKLPDSLEEFYMSRVVVITSGKLFENAIERLYAKYEKQLRSKNLQFWDKAKIETLIKKHGI